MNNKFDVFTSVPLSSLSQVDPENKTTSHVAGIAEEFEKTNQHTQDTGSQGSATQAQETTQPTDPNTSDKAKGKQSLGSVLKAKNAVGIIDLVIPSIVCFVISKAGYYLEKKEMKLDKDEQDAVIPALQDALNSIHINLDNPWHVLGIVLGIVYGTKIMDNWEKIQPKEAIKTPEQKIQESNELTDPEKFEQEYNIIVKEAVKKRRKGVPDAKIWLAKNEPEKIRALMAKYNITDEKYLNTELS